MKKENKKEAKANKKLAKESKKATGGKSSSRGQLHSTPLEVAKRDSHLVHKFLKMAAAQPGAPKGIIKVASKEQKALSTGIKDAKKQKAKNFIK